MRWLGVLLVLGLLTGCSTYGSAVTTLMTPAAKATTKAVYPEYQWPNGQSPKEKASCVPPAVCP